MKDASANAALKSVGLSTADQGVLLMVPMALVAWADGDADVDEMEAIARRQCRAHGSTGSCVMDITDSGQKYFYNHFMYRQPNEELADKMVDILADVLSALPDEKAGKLRALITEMMVDVAKVSGGFLGIGRIAAAEREMIQNISERLKLRLDPDAYGLLDEIDA